MAARECEGPGELVRNVHHKVNDGVNETHKQVAPPAPQMGVSSQPVTECDHTQLGAERVNKSGYAESYASSTQALGANVLHKGVDKRVLYSNCAHHKVALAGVHCADDNVGDAVGDAKCARGDAAVEGGDGDARAVEQRQWQAAELQTDAD